jgi:glycine/D-amino acid oxidase-like deaminating enzyme
VATGVAATAVTIHGDRLVTVSTSAGDVDPGTVVFATGQPPVLDGLPLTIPSDRVKGHLLVTEATSVRLPGIVAPVATQLEDGRLLAGGTFDIGDEDPAIQPDVIESIMAGLVAALPAAKGHCVPVVLLPAPPPRPAAGHRSSPRPGQRLAHLGTLQDRHTQRPGHGCGARPLDLGRSAPARARHLVGDPLHSVGGLTSLRRSSGSDPCARPSR